MIFVTVGTHYLPFDRLLSWVQACFVRGVIQEEVIVQSGTSNIRIEGAYQMAQCSFQEMKKFIRTARLVITHAGPATLSLIWQHHPHVPIVVPRMQYFGEHVSDHQVYFAEYLEKKGNITLIMNLDQLSSTIAAEPSRQFMTSKLDQKLSHRLHHYLLSS